MFSGVGYLRLLPYTLIKYWIAKSNYVMTYLHPRDFDTTQPIINELSAIHKFKSYVGLKTAETKLEKWLSDFEFTDMSAAIQKIDWDNVPVVEI